MLILYVLGHLAGNLQIYLSQNRINHHVGLLHRLETGALGMRLILLVGHLTR